MGDILQAFFVFLALFVGTFICGYLPSCISAPPHAMNKIAIFGGGTIIGAAIIVVLPESCGILINAQNKLDTLQGVTSTSVVTKQVAMAIGLAITFGFTLMLLIDETFKIIKERQIMSQIET